VAAWLVRRTKIARSVERLPSKEAAVRLQQVLTAEGISEEELLSDFKQWRAGRRK